MATEKQAFEHKLLKASKQIERATLHLYNLESILKEICQTIHKELGFDFISISLASKQKKTIEAIHGIGVAREWAGKAGHYLEEDQALRDIQADIVATCRTEVISGWDSRFDRFIYEEYGHDRFVRIYTPIILVRDRSGEISDWYEQCQWTQIEPAEEKKDGQHIIIEMAKPPKEMIVLGTIEAGYEDRNRQIEPQEAIDLAKLVAQQALKIYRGRLLYVLETIAKSAMQILDADAATLHFPYDFEQQRHIYQVCAGSITLSQLDKMRPRRDGLGQKAIQEKKPKCIPDLNQDYDEESLKNFNPKVWEDGARAMAAFPLMRDEEEEILDKEGILNKKGILYIVFHRKHQFTQEQLDWGNFIANRAISAIGQAITFRNMRGKNSQLAILDSITRSLVQKGARDNLLHHIAWNTLNILSADVVTIYEYSQVKKEFPIRQKGIAGRFKIEHKIESEKIDEGNVPFKLIEHGKNVYYFYPPLTKEATLKEIRIFEGSSFANQESIKSVAGILIKIDEEIVGVMFINYRRPHDFLEDERHIIETLASSAAIAIKNQRFLEALRDIDREIISTLDRKELLSKIVRLAVQLTGADLGGILFLDPTTQKLVRQVDYPGDEPFDPQFEELPIGEGITGWVAKEHQSLKVNDVKNDHRYRAYYQNVRSELCVPLLDKSNQVLGVLNVESRQIRKFTSKDLSMLESLADQTVIAIQNVGNKEKLIANEKIDPPLGEGDLASTLRQDFIQDFIAENQENLKRSRCVEQIIISLRATNKADLKQFPKDERDFIYEQFCKKYEFLNLIFDTKKGMLEVSERERMERFMEIREQKKTALRQNDIERFRKNATKFTQLLCEALAFNSMIEQSASFGQLYGQMIDSSNPAFQLNIRPIFPIIYAFQTDFSEEDINNVNGLLHRLEIYANYFALLVVCENHQKIRSQIRQSAYRNDFIVLSYAQIWNILAAKSPIQQLRNIILEQIDLVAISPYTTAGPVKKGMFFGRAEEEKTLLQNISRNNYALLANRRMGKTSLIERIFPRLKEISEYQVFKYDLQSVSDHKSFYQLLASSCSNFEEEIEQINEFQPLDFGTIIKNIKRKNDGQQIIFIFDEVDELLTYDVEYNEILFKTFRSLAQSENIHFIFSGSTTLFKRMIHSDSPLLNFCEKIIIKLLDEKAAQELVTIPMKNIGVKFENEEVIVRRILSITAKHPNVIQYICDQLIKIINKKQERVITEEDLQQVINSHEFYDHFEKLIWGQSTDLEKLIVYFMWSKPEFTEYEVIQKFRERFLPSEEIKNSLEALQIYSTLSKKDDKYFFTFHEFAKFMKRGSNIEGLKKEYLKKIKLKYRKN